MALNPNKSITLSKHKETYILFWSNLVIKELLFFSIILFRNWLSLSQFSPFLLLFLKNTCQCFHLEPCFYVTCNMKSINIHILPVITKGKGFLWQILFYNFLKHVFLARDRFLQRINYKCLIFHFCFWNIEQSSHNKVFSTIVFRITWNNSLYRRRFKVFHWYLAECSFINL